MRSNLLGAGTVQAQFRAQFNPEIIHLGSKSYLYRGEPRGILRAKHGIFRVSREPLKIAVLNTKSEFCKTLPHWM
jgi:hypothetical protein